MQNIHIYLVDIPERKADGTYVAQSTIFDKFRERLLVQDSAVDLESIQEKALMLPPVIGNWSRATRFEVRFAAGSSQLSKVRVAIDETRVALGLQAVRLQEVQRDEEIR